jgi:hypothetical protein
VHGKEDSENYARDGVPSNLRMVRCPQIPESREEHCRRNDEEEAVRESEPTRGHEEFLELHQTDGETLGDSSSLGEVAPDEHHEHQTECDVE